MARKPPLEFKKPADRWLLEHRPDRYVDQEWIEEGVEALYLLFPEDDEDPRKTQTREYLSKRETSATHRANKILRSFAETGQLELHWKTTANEPLAIVYTIADDDGEEQKIQERVALRALTPLDLRNFASAEHESTENDHKARLRTCDGARLMADDMEATHAQIWTDWASRQLIDA